MNQKETFLSEKGPFEYTDNGTGEVILAIHGAMGGYDQSEILAEAIAPSGYRIISVSRPGYLGTPLSVGKTPEKQADLFVDLLNYLQVKQVIVMAISGGGYSALYFAHRHPDRCRGLVLCSTTGGPNDEKIPFSFKIFQLMARFKSLVAFLRNQSDKNFEATLKRGIPQEDIREAFMKNNETMALFRRLNSGMFHDLSQRLEGTKNDIHQTKNLTYPLKEITTPVLVIHGTEDSVVPFAKHGKRLAEELPNVDLFAADRGEHVTVFTHRQAVRDQVSRFLDRLML